MDWSVDTGSDVPPSRQIVHVVLDALAAGVLTANEQLPPVRQLAARALVNHNTAARAYRDLEQLGIVRGHNGLGVFVTEEGPALASELRRETTLHGFESAAHEALRAGHEPRALAALLGSIQKRTSP